MKKIHEEDYIAIILTFIFIITCNFFISMFYNHPIDTKETTSSSDSITIPNSVTSIGDKAFEGCKNLTTTNNENYIIKDGILYDESHENEKILNSCLQLDKTIIIIPYGVTSIGDAAFKKCYNLKSITIPNSVTSIGEWTFSGCSENLKIIRY